MHMDIFLTLSIVKETFNHTQGASITSANSILAKHDLKDVQLSNLDFQHILDDPPTTHQLCHALKEKGFAPGFIATYLDIKQPSVSYHLSRPLKKPYTNKYLLNAINRAKAEYLKHQNY